VTDAIHQVQNIGDAYLVVSGLPKPNGDQHIVEICDVALMHLEVLSRFKIRHLPEEKLLMRLGLHTGPCAAGNIIVLNQCVDTASIVFSSPSESKETKLKLK
jgi:class 3 adenylate cyclase